MWGYLDKIFVYLAQSVRYMRVLSICSWCYSVKYQICQRVTSLVLGLLLLNDNTNIDLGVTANPISRVFVDEETQIYHKFYLYSCGNATTYLAVDDCSMRKYICTLWDIYGKYICWIFIELWCKLEYEISGLYCTLAGLPWISIEQLTG